jgi:hypothetical protein
MTHVSLLSSFYYNMNLYAHTRYRILMRLLTPAFFSAHPYVTLKFGVGLRPLACWDCGFESHLGMDVFVLLVLCVVR